MECPNLESIVPFLLRNVIAKTKSFETYSRNIEDVEKFYQPNLML